MPISPRGFFRQAVLGLTIFALAIHSLGCGTLLHPDRINQPHSGRIDPAIAIFDGVGLILFLVPGLIAFGVDFATGAIYLPPDYTQTGGPMIDPKNCDVIHLPPEELTMENLEKVVAERTGKTFELKPGSYETRPFEENVEVLGQSE